MFKILSSQKYSRINNNDDDKDYFINHNENYYNQSFKNKSIKNRIFNKICFKKFNFFKCFILFIIIFFFFSFIVEILIKTQIKSINKINEIIKTIIESNKIQINNYNITKNRNITKSEKDKKVDKNITKNRNITKSEKDKKVDKNITKNTNITKSEKDKKVDKNITKESIEKKEPIKIKEKEKEKEEKKPKNENIYKEEKFDSLHVAYSKAKDFLDKCMKGILIQDKNKFVSTENPKVSAVIPIYNSKRFISRAIKSIQNQNLLNLEIVLVNDFSTDDTLSYVEEIQKDDSRIKIIKNKKNMGILYSRSIGALSSKGKYIFPLDNDDMFLDKDVFETITSIADKGNFDLVEFKGVFSLQGGSNLLNNRIQDTYFSGHKLNLVMFQPELGNYPVRPGNQMGKYVVHDVFLWTKCIRTKIYQKGLNKLGEERYSRHMLLHEDLVATCILFNTAESYKFVGKYGVFHIQRPGSASWRRFSDVDNNKYIMYLTDIAIDFSQDAKKNKILLVYLITFLMNQKQLDRTLKSSEYIEKLFISCLNRILNSKYISDEYKNEIRKRGKKLKFINYQF